MKKFVSGIIVGVLMFAGTVVFADSVGLIGKKVTGIFTIEQDGKKVADAVIIDGSAYAPVRAVAEASGTKLLVEGKKIIMGDETAKNKVETEELKIKQSALISKIDAIKNGLKIYETDVLPRAENAYEGSIGTIEETGRKQWLDDRKAEYERDKKELTVLEAQLKKLDAQLSELIK